MSSLSSIFSFRTLRSGPSAVVPLLTVLLLAGLILLASRFFFNRSNYLYLLEPCGGITAMDRLCREIKHRDLSCNESQLLEKKLPEIIVAGDSRNEGIYPEILEEQTGMVTASVTLAGSNIWELVQCLKVFEPAFERCRIIVFDLSAVQFMQRNGLFQSGNTFTILRQRGDSYPGYGNISKDTWKADILPIRLSFRQVIEIVLAMRNNASDPENWWKIRDGEGEYHPEYTSKQLEQALEFRRSMPFNDRLLPAIRFFLEETQRRGIQVVINSVPTYQGRTFNTHMVISLPRDLCDTELDHTYEKLCQEIEQWDNVFFIGPQRFSDIGVEQDESELFVDDHHLSGVGGQIYSRYIAGEILKLINSSQSKTMSK
ncbi:MAG: hypothetical protein IKE64_00435 [Thermoguttaceae bacterium]|nr:hypothetical protein [Thermoguttaceae bacterium]